MNRYYGTFKSQSEYRDYYIVINADTELEAKELMDYSYPTLWSMVYPEDSFQKQYFPKGPLAILNNERYK